MSSFWTDKATEPKRAYRFRIKSNDGISGNSGDQVWWNAKKVDKPSFTINTNKYRLINHEINLPGIVSWNPITIEIADIGNTVNNLLKDIGDKGGYNPSELTKDKGIAKVYGSKILTGLTIQQLNGSGKPTETWTLEGAFISEFRISSFDYTSDEIVSVTLTLTYDYAKLE